MIRRIKLANLKAFAGHHDVRLAPLTLVYGANSAGKSTLMQALLLLKQTFESSDLEQPALVVRGTLTDLGSFPGIIHDHQDDLTLELGLEFAVAPLSHRTRAPVPDNIVFAFKWDEEAHAIRQTSVRIGHLGQPVVTLTRRRGPYSASVETAKPDSAPFRIGQKEARSTFLRWMIANARTSHASAQKVFPDRRLPPELFDELRDNAKYATGSWGITPMYPDFTSVGLTDKASAALSEIEQAWYLSLLNLRSELTWVMDSLVYLGPLRRAPERFYLLSGAQRKSVGREGEYAAEILSRRPDLADAVSDWLGRMGIPYLLTAEHIAGGQMRHSIGDVVVLVLKDQRNPTVQLSPSDVGFGISQLLPIVVQVLAGSGNTICVEQPEIHVHPRLQANMADLFVEAMKHLDNQLVIETHSEHLMLRLQRLIRRGSLNPQEVAILYVDEDGRGNASVTEIGLDDTGAFTDEWPRGFFSERYDEVFGN